MADAASHDLIVTLGANAHGLLAGAPVASVRRRLKIASLLYDRLLLEEGILDVQAGPQGSSVFRHSTTADEPTAWQTARQRSAVKGKTFTIGVGRESTSGVPAETVRAVLSSETVIRWRATLEPFVSELPAGCDWIEWVYRTRSIPSEIGSVARRWTDIDKANAVLARRFPADHVRSRVISDTNEDLALAGASGLVLSADPLHSQVLASRLDDRQGWRLQGFALPIVVPAVGDLSWETIRDLRKDKALRYLRSAMLEIEFAAMEAATSQGDLESAVRGALEVEVAKTNGKEDELNATLKRTIVGVVVATGIGFATTGVTGPLGIVVAAFGSSIVGAILDARTALQTRQSRAWMGSLARIKSAATDARAPGL